MTVSKGWGRLDFRKHLLWQCPSFLAPGCLRSVASGSSSLFSAWLAQAVSPLSPCSLLKIAGYAETLASEDGGPGLSSGS